MSVYRCDRPSYAGPSVPIAQSGSNVRFEFPELWDKDRYIRCRLTEGLAFLGCPETVTVVLLFHHPEHRLTASISTSFKMTNTLLNPFSGRDGRKEATLPGFR